MKNIKELPVVRIDETNIGFTVWFNNRWLIDASCFFDQNGKIIIATNRLKKIGMCGDATIYRFSGDKLDKIKTK